MKVRNVLVLTYWSYSEALIQTYTLPYVRIIRSDLPTDGKIFLVTLEKQELKLTREATTRIKSELALSGIYWMPFSYYNFGIRAALNWMLIFARLFILLLRSGSISIHCWCTPAGAIGYWLSLLTGKKLVLDSYEPHAESMVENGTWKKNSTAFRILFWLEKKQSQRAAHVVACTVGMRQYARDKYGVDLKNFVVKPACVDLNFFTNEKSKNIDLLERFKLKDKIVCVYAGKFGGIYLDKEVFDFLKLAHAHWGNHFRVMLLTGHSEAEIKRYCELADLDFSIIIMKHVPHAEIPVYIGLGDFALTPVKPVPTKKYCTPIKDGEYWAMGLPVIIPGDISDDSSIIESHRAGVVMNGFNNEEYRRVILEMESILKKPRHENFATIRGLAERYRGFSIAREVYHQIYLTD